MKYKELQEILDILEEIPNERKRDKATRLILQAANESITYELIQDLLSRDNKPSQEQTIKRRDDTIFWKLTNKEIQKMPTRFQKEIIIQDKIVKVRRRKSGKHTTNYEIRYRRDGFNVTASSTDLEIAKEKFAQALRIADLKRRQVEERKMLIVPETFQEFAEYYFEKYRKRKVAEKTFENDMYRYRNHIKPYFRSMPLKDITPDFCQELLDKFAVKGQTKTSNEIYSLLNGIFKMAIAHDFMKKNPLAIVIVEKHNCKHGKALTKEEEKKLLDETKGTKYETIFALALYTGLRPNEYKTARIERNFIVARNSKRKGGKIEYKKIPISGMLKPYLQGIEVLNVPTLEYVRYAFNAILPNHILYDLRTTFYTRCEECGVAPPARDHFVGHSNGELNNTYSDLSDEYLLKEGKKLVW
ncbi:MAG: tyrosine-type recombinase/integrase family protein [Clostridia bacterium]|nr:tyrosine-type recombinase/integrase family protein [Clostridia bacterium]